MSNLGQNNKNDSNFDSIIGQVWFIPGCGINKSNNRFNPTFVLQRHYIRGGRGGFRPTYGHGRGFVPSPFTDVIGGFNKHYKKTNNK